MQYGILEELTKSVDILGTQPERHANQWAVALDILASILEEIRGLRNNIQRMNKQKKRKRNPCKSVKAESTGKDKKSKHSA